MGVRVLTVALAWPAVVAWSAMDSHARGSVPRRQHARHYPIFLCDWEVDDAMEAEEAFARYAELGLLDERGSPNTDGPAIGGRWLGEGQVCDEGDDDDDTTPQQMVVRVDAALNPGTPSCHMRRRCSSRTPTRSALVTWQKLSRKHLESVANRDGGTRARAADGSDDGNKLSDFDQLLHPDWGGQI